MRAFKLLIGFAFVLALGATGAWLARGEFDRHFMLNGRFFVLNAVGKEAEITLRFPSGVERIMPLRDGAVSEFVLRETGEGSIEVLVDGDSRDRVGYVTSFNPLVVLVVGENKTRYSQINPALALP